MAAGEASWEVTEVSRGRGVHFAVAEVGRLLADVARVVFDGHDEGGGHAPLRVANASLADGGDIRWSVSHNSGRDVDLVFFAVDGFGRPAHGEHLVRFGADGVATGPEDVAGRLYFDTPRNWALVEALLGHPLVTVQWLFVSAPLEQMMLDHALRVGASATVRERARRVMVQPRDAGAHDDHLHVRIACPTDDRPECIDGPGRTGLNRAAQVDTLLRMYEHGSPAEKRYAREILSLPDQGTSDDAALPAPVEGDTR